MKITYFTTQRIVLALATWVLTHTLHAQSFRSQPVALTKAESSAVQARVTAFKTFSLNTAALHATVAGHSGKPQTVDLALSEAASWKLTLEPNELRTTQYQATLTDEGGTTKLPSTLCQTYKGFADGNPTQTARLLITENTIQGFVKQQKEFWCIEPLATFTGQASPQTFVLFRQADIIAASGLYCGVTAAAEKQYERLNPAGSAGIPQQRSCLTKELEIATDADYEYYQRYGANSNQQIISILNQVEGVYESTFQLHFRLTSQHVWSTSNDPYTSINGSTTMSELENYWNTNGGGVTRDVLHLFSGKNYQGLYGQSEIGVICANASLSYSFSVDRVGVYLTTAHEIGHNFSGLHGDGVNCGSSSASIMCQGEKSLYFSSAEISRIGGYINSHSGCISPPVPVATGPDAVCANATFTLQNVPAGASVSWTTSGNLTPTAGTGAVASVSPNGAGAGYVEFAIAGFCTATLQKPTYVGVLNLSSNRFNIQGPCFNYAANGPGNTFLVCPSENITATPAATWSGEPFPATAAQQWQWRWVYTLPSGAATTFYTNGYANVTAPSQPRQQSVLTLEVNDGCGWGTAGTMVLEALDTSTGEEPFRMSGTMPVKAYPNPVNDVLFLPAGSKGAALLNSQGKAVAWPDGTNHISTQGLPAGLYNLRIEQNGKVSNQHIEVAH